MLKALSIASFLLMVAALVGLLVTHSFFGRGVVAIAAQVAAVGLMVWARLTFGRRSFHASADPTAGGLVTAGPYRFIRHPIYTAACVLGWAGVLSHWSMPAALLGVALTIGAVSRMLCEEWLLVRSYPEYRQYAAATRRMVPYLF
jgi:protein-S-isoprenylcysteine O-methyltransferase Ste14